MDTEKHRWEKDFIQANEFPNLGAFQVRER
jgi:hypothetical protein